MAVEKSALRITELDFDGIRENLKNFLRSQTEFQDFDFEGSGMSVLLDILAYNTHYMGFYANMVGNEMFLDTAQLRASVLSHAKMINYVPKSSSGATASINVKVTPNPGDTTNVLTIDKYTKLLGRDKDGVNYPFVTLYSNTAPKVSGSFQFSNVQVKQGQVNTLQYQMSPFNDSRRFTIPSSNVDVSSIVVNVQESSTNSFTTVYTKADDITDLTGNSAVYFIEEDENLNYTLYFGDNILGKRPKDGNVIFCTYLDTVGSISNNITKLSFIDPIGGFSNISTTTVSSSYGGSDKESIQDVQFRAPYYYTTQNRAVVNRDYESLILKNYSYVDAASVWGGEENDPVIYGKVFASLKTKGNYNLTNYEKENIKNDLTKKFNILTVTPEIVDPEYVYLQVKGNVIYNPRLTTLNASELKTRIRASIQDFSDQQLNKFKTDFVKSKLLNYIENSDPSITGSDLSVFVQKRITIDPALIKNYSVNFNMPIKHSLTNEKLSSYPEIQVYDTNGIIRNVLFEEVLSTDTGIASVTILDGGKNYSSVPTVTVVGDGTGAILKARIGGGRIVGIDVVSAGSDYSTATIQIIGGGGSGASAVSKLKTNQSNLRNVYYNTTGEKVILNSNIGSIDYATGVVNISPQKIIGTVANDFYDNNVLTFSVLSANDIIEPLRNRIVVIDFNDPKSVQINMIAR